MEHQGDSSGGESFEAVVEHDAANDVLWVRLRGELVAECSDVLYDEMERAAHAGVRQVVVDFEGLGFTDSSGLRTLVYTLPLFRLPEAPSISFVHPQPNVARTIEMAGLAKSFPFSPPLEAPGS